MKKNIQKYLKKYKPTPWCLIKDHSNQNFINNNSLVMNLNRFNLIANQLESLNIEGKTILDVGAYPGILPQILSEYLAVNKQYKYYAAGLGFHADFIEKMKSLSVELLEVELDPRFYRGEDRNTRIPVEKNDVDICIFTDVIEHFFDPMHALFEINRSLKMNGKLILTTDNISRLGSLVACLKGKSPQVPLIEGPLFFSGDWRPHFREYSKNELYQLLKWSGFKVESHQYFDAEFSKFKFINDRLEKVNKPKLSKQSIKQFIFDWIGKLVPHLRDNQILVASKEVDYDTAFSLSPKVVNDHDEWTELRKKFSN